MKGKNGGMDILSYLCAQIIQFIYMLKRIIIIPVILAACLCNVHGQKVVRAADFYSLMHELDKTERPNLRKDAFDFRTAQRHVYVSDEFADSFFKTDTTYV